MGFFEEKYNKGKRIDWNVDIENFEFVKLADLEFDKKYQIFGCYTHDKSKFGETGVLILEDCLVDVPQHKVDEIKDLRNDLEAINLIKNGKCGIELYEYEDNNGVDRISYNLITLD